MTKIKSLAMGTQIASDARISHKSSFFNLINKYYYAPTGSLITAQRKEFTPLDGLKLEHALNCGDPKKRASHIAALEKMHETALGNYMLEMCQSADGCYCAVQLSQFKQLRYEPVTPICTFEGEDAQIVINSL